MENKETRTNSELRNESNRAAGYAANFQEYDMGTFREKISPSAFRNLESYDVHALLNHNYDKVLARSKFGAGTLELRVDDQGLSFGFEFPKTATGSEARELVERGDVDQCSWAFTVKSERWEDVSSEKPLRVIDEVASIYDISLTPRGANPSTTVALRSLVEAQEALEQPEQNLIETKKEIIVENTENTPETEARFIPAASVQGKLSTKDERDLGKFNIV
ncbi:MAG: HK97 family phage prohead protease, partial [Planctomycetota bacterium]